MRICFVSDPNSIHTRRWVNWFAQHGHTVCVVADIPLREAWPGMEIIDLSKSFYAPILRFPIWAIFLKRILHRWRPDILHAHRVNSAGWVAAASGFHPLVVTLWGSDINLLGKQGPLIRWLARFVLQRADLITGDAQDLLNSAQSYGAHPDRLRLVQWGADLAHFYPAPADRKLIDELHLGGGPVILSPRAVKPIYRLETIIQAIARVCKTMPGATLILRDYNTEPDYKKQLETLIDTLGLTEQVRWLGRLEPWERQADIYRLADVVVSVPSTDSTPASVLEALACGVPVITSDLPALREWIIPGETGLIVPVGDKEATARAILQMLTDTQLADRLRKAGPAVVERRADHQAEMRKMETYYQDLVKDH